MTTFDYDGGGRQIRQSDSRNVFNVYDQLTRVEDAQGRMVVQHTYGFDGQRTWTQTAGQGEQRWFSSGYTATTKPNGTVERLHYVTVNERVVARLSFPNKKVSLATALTQAAGTAFPFPSVPATLGALCLVLLAAAMRRPRQLVRAGVALVTIYAFLLGPLGCGRGSEQDDQAALALELLNSRVYFHQGLSAGPVLLTDHNGAVADERRFEPFGHPIEADLTEDPRNILNKETDRATGWSYHGARWHSPQTARWLSGDPRVKEPNPDLMSTGPWNLNPYDYAGQNPIGQWDPDGHAPRVVGHIYVATGMHEGQLQTYVGSTVQSISKRFNRHTWKAFLMDKSTTIDIHEFQADLNVPGSNRGTLLSAKIEASRAAEQRVKDSLGSRSFLNKVEPATPQNMKSWMQRHSVTFGRTFRFTGRVGAFAGFALLDAYKLWLNERTSRYVMAPYALQDEGGIFTLGYRGLVFRDYYKTYVDGPMKGTEVPIRSDEFDFLRKEAELLWGTLDFKGDFVPGLLRRELPEIVEIH